MKKAEILRMAVSHHDSDPCAVFAVDTRSGLRYYRTLGNSAPDPQRTEVRIGQRRGGTTVWFVEVLPVSENGDVMSYDRDSLVAGFRDASECSRIERDTRPIQVSRVIECVNVKQSFADYVNAERSKAREAAKRREEAEEARRVTAFVNGNRRKETAKRIAALLGHGATVDESTWLRYDALNEAIVKLDDLIAIIEIAERQSVEQTV